MHTYLLHVGIRAALGYVSLGSVRRKLSSAPKYVHRRQHAQACVVRVISVLNRDGDPASKIRCRTVSRLRGAVVGQGPRAGCKRVAVERPRGLGRGPRRSRGGGDHLQAQRGCHGAATVFRQGERGRRKGGGPRVWSNLFSWGGVTPTARRGVFVFLLGGRTCVVVCAYNTEYTVFSWSGASSWDRCANARKTEPCLTLLIFVTGAEKWGQGYTGVPCARSLVLPTLGLTTGAHVRTATQRHTHTH